VQADPLKWLGEGMRSVFLPSSFEAAGQGGDWNLVGAVIVTGLWLVVGLVVARLSFR
jgi:ABC-2 type transport system permease protein